jgi:hypothetical protein
MCPKSKDSKSIGDPNKSGLLMCWSAFFQIPNNRSSSEGKAGLFKRHLKWVTVSLLPATLRVTALLYD